MITMIKEKKAVDFPFDEVIQKANKSVCDGHAVFQKFTCENCSNRLTIEEPNRFYETATCDKCHHETNIKERGCNYVLVMLF